MYTCSNYICVSILYRYVHCTYVVAMCTYIEPIRTYIVPIYMTFFISYPLSALGHDISPRADTSTEEITDLYQNV